MTDRTAVIDWLLDPEHSDPSIRWQVMRDLLDAPHSEWAAERAKVETEGWGARLLALEDDDGQWAGGAHFPGDFDFDGPEADRGPQGLPSGGRVYRKKNAIPRLPTVDPSVVISVELSPPPGGLTMLISSPC